MRATIPFVVAAFAATAHADFGQIDQFPLATSSGQAHGITTDGASWYIAQIFSPQWDVFDADFNYVSTTTAPGSQFRGISYRETTGTMLAADYGTGEIRECALDGSQLDVLPGLGSMNAIAAHRIDGTFWIATFANGIYHYDADGSPLGSFTVPFFVTGLAIDEAAGTLLILESNDDLVYEYDFDGASLGAVIASDQVPDNGQGLFYDAYTATLYATTQTPATLTIFQDPDRPTLGDDCFADCDGNGELNILDFVCYQGLFQSGDDAADCDANGQLNILDFVCFQGEFQAGCD